MPGCDAGGRSPDNNVLPGAGGCMTFYYTNAQSARLQFYHDHAHGITRLNVYAGEAAGYVLTDAVEQDMIKRTNFSGVNPGKLKVLPGIAFPSSSRTGRSWTPARFSPRTRRGTGEPGQGMAPGTSRLPTPATSGSPCLHDRPEPVGPDWNEWRRQMALRTLVQPADASVSG